MLVIASPTAMRADARRRRAARAACARRSPSPRRRSRRSRRASPRSRRPAPATARPSDRARTSPPTVRSPIVTRNVLSATVGRPQHAIARLGDGRRRRGRAARAARATRLDVARHLRRLAEQHVERHVDRRVAERAVVDDAAGRRRWRVPTHRERAALALAQRARTRASALGRDREHVALLRLVAPDLAAATCRARRVGIARSSSARADARRRATSSGSAFDRPPAPTSWIDRIGLRVAERASSGRSLPGAALDLGVAALHRIEVEIRGVGARSPSTTPRRRPGRSASPGRRARSAARPPASGAFCDVRGARSLPRPPAIMIGLW